MKILFISHDTSRTGAPFVLLYFLQWIREHHPKVDVTVLSLEGGVLSNQFKKNSHKYIELDKVKTSQSTFFQELRNKMLKRLGFKISAISPRDNFIKELGKENFDIIYANTVVSAPVAVKIKRIGKKGKLFLHVHESKQVIESRIPNLQKYIPEVDIFIAASNLVKENLTSRYKISEEKIKIIYEFIITSNFNDQEDRQENFIVGGSGAQIWRKGGDLFLQVAYIVRKYLPEAQIKFIWVGHLSKQEALLIQSDIEKAGLTDVVDFIGEQIEPIKVFSSFDIFLMTSREDPFPLVCIEAGMLGKPILCFLGATGTEEVLRNGGGKISPYLDTTAMAKNVIQYYEDRNELLKDGKKAKELFSEFSVEKTCPKLFELIKLHTTL